MRSSRNSGLMAALALASIAGLGAVAQAAPIRSNANPPRPRRVDVDRERMTAQQREIAEWNAAVEAKKAAKRDRKQWRT